MKHLNIKALANELYFYHNFYSLVFFVLLLLFFFIYFCSLQCSQPAPLWSSPPSETLVYLEGACNALYVVLLIIIFFIIICFCYYYFHLYACSLVASYLVCVFPFVFEVFFFLADSLLCMQIVCG